MEYDPLRDSAVAYANALRLAENAVKLIKAEKIAEAREELGKALEWLEKAEGMEKK